MIKITNDKYEFKVTKGVFEDKFKPLGYKIIEEKKNTTDKNVVKEKIDSVDNIDKKEDKKEKETIEEGITRKLQKDRK